jgi:hypothetical protein
MNVGLMYMDTSFSNSPYIGYYGLVDYGTLFYLTCKYNIFERPYASIFRSQVPEDEGNMFLRNVDIYTLWHNAMA